MVRVDFTNNYIILTLAGITITNKKKINETESKEKI